MPQEQLTSAAPTETEPAASAVQADLDAETAELLRSLESPSPVDDARDPSVPLSGVLKRSSKPRAKGADDSSPSLASLSSAAMAYQPLPVEAPWVAESSSLANVTDPTPRGPIVPAVTAEFFDEHDAIEEVAEIQEVTEPRKTAPKPPPRPAKPPPAPASSGKEKGAESADEAADSLPGGRLDEGKDLEHNYADTGWYAEVFNEDYFRTLPKNFHKQTVREVNFVLERLGVEPGARLLDLCCGFGRHTMIMSKMGYDMVGLDLSMTLLQKALSEAQRRNLSIKFIHGDMRKLNFQNVFDGIFNLQTSFGFFNDQTNFRVLQGIFRALKPGGRLLIETINRDFIANDLPMRVWWEGTECLILEEVDLDYLLGMLKVKRSFVFEDASRDPWEQNISVRLYTPSELRQMLTRVGFRVLELSGDYAVPGAFFGTTSRLMIMVAERPVA